jgi:tetratricopeptide (TPR) repeat protein
MPKYVVGQESNIWGNDRTVIRSSPTAYDVGSAIGGGLGMLATWNRNAKSKAIIHAIETGEKHLESGDYKKALDVANVLIRSTEREVQMIGHALKGIACDGLSEYDEAIREYSTTLDIASALDQPEYIGPVFVRRGGCYLHKNDLGAAMRDFANCIRLRPNEDEGYYWQAVALTRLGDLDEALANFSRAISINPGYATHYRERADVHARRHETEKAIADYSRAITLDPQDVFCYERRAELYAEINDDVHAIADYSRAIELSPDNHKSYSGRAAAYQRTGDAARSGVDMATAQQLATASAQELANRAAQRWQHCETGWQTLPAKGRFGSRPIAFCAATDPKANQPFAISDPTDYNLVNERGGLVPRKTQRAEQVFNAFMTRLASEGWEAYESGDYWYSRKLRKRTRG